MPDGRVILAPFGVEPTETVARPCDHVPSPVGEGDPNTNITDIIH